MRRANGRRENRLDLIWQKFTDWLKEILIGGITDALSGLFDTVNTRVGEIAGQVGATPQGWNGGIYNMIRSLSSGYLVHLQVGVQNSLCGAHCQQHLEHRHGCV